MKPFHILVLTALVCAVCLTGCAKPRPVTDPVLDKTAWQSAAAIRKMNQDIRTSKGTGRVRLESGNSIQTFQIAWAAQAPDRVRMTFTASGLPVETIVADGSRVTFISHTGRHRPYSPASENPDLEPYTQVPVRLSDLISLLLGRIPVQNFDDAWFLPDDPFRIRLRKKFSSLSQEMLLHPDDTLNMLRLLDRENTARWEIHYHAFDRIKKHMVPVHMTITSGSLQKVQVRITRFWPNIPVKESVFQLTPGGS
ncbi:MAG: DUF4292 domain-containing protein [Desulfotignum sp.]|jgi:outer membrane biogenesis lipoprotein LolB|nr:DUF4292 domain-containing protein [Desulfotignum sp.]